MPGTFILDFPNNRVIITGGTSGSPADFASFVAADRAGAGTSLLAAWSPNSNTKALTNQVRPVELLALLISFVVAGKTAETDYIFITGTDAWGAAQTEAINVSAGDGTYPTTKRFRTITNIDCSDNAAGGGTVWANGTVAVTQPIWGVIWQLTNKTYQIDVRIDFGNGSTSTYFLDKSPTTNTVILSLSSGYPILKLSNATVIFGEVADETNKQGKNGINFIRTGAATEWNMGDIKCYGCSFKGGMYLRGSSSGARYWNCSGDMTFQESANTDFNNILFSSGSMAGRNESADNTMSGFRGVCTYLSYNSMRALSDANLFFTMLLTLQYPQADCYLTDCTFNIWKFYWTNQTGDIYRQYTFNLHLTDQGSTNISGASVVLKDKDGNTVFSVSSGADGKIAQQTVLYRKYVHVLNNYNGDAYNPTEYGPHTLTITKAGYQDYQDVITIDRKMDLEVALALEADVQWPQCPVEGAIEGMVFGNPDAPLAGVYHEAAVGEVKKDVAFGPNSSYLGARVDCPAIKALESSGNYGDPASPLVGTYHEAEVGEVIEGTEYGSPEAPLAGAYHEALAGEVKKDVAFGPNSAYLGTLVPQPIVNIGLELSLEVSPELNVHLESENLI
jgi:hypothetical protein